MPRGNLKTEKHQSYLAKLHFAPNSTVESRNFEGEDSVTSEA